MINLNLNTASFFKLYNANAIHQHLLTFDHMYLVPIDQSVKIVGADNYNKSFLYQNHLNGMLIVLFNDLSAIYTSINGGHTYIKIIDKDNILKFLKVITFQLNSANQESQINQHKNLL